MSKVMRFYDKISDPDKNGCWNWIASVMASGYGQIRVGDKNWSSHRFAWTHFFGDIPKNLHVLHKCDNRRCVNPEHLFIGTHLDNVADMVAKGRNSCGGVKGEKHGCAKLTESDVRKIRSDPRTLKEIGKQFGVSFAQISHIKLRKSWKHVK